MENKALLYGFSLISHCGVPTPLQVLTHKCSVFSQAWGTDPSCCPYNTFDEEEDSRSSTSSFPFIKLIL